ncbi:glyoxalase [Flavipsychrobacter stenotrophus]|uniref:Glyoxalase n=1 Tax=Flavipsychrobacter stenotrophus TaxID=2077091 RepID=A0A2S7SSW8_9BACT|nr:VOC family protein [Flavipsychrobacter stenotrophus]PQJ09721.1 glyoxalase [Flavipsychrobacter stenotrophus]
MGISLHTVGITVKDLGKALQFYRILGLPIPEGQDNEHHVEYTSDNGYSIGFIPESTMLQTNPHWQAPTGDNRISLQFGCDTPAQVNETYDKLVASGFKSFKEPWDAFWGQRFAQVIDPDGNNVAFFADL